MPKTPSSRRSADDRGFRLGTGFFALLVVLLVAGIAFELCRNSQLSIAKFGFAFWRDEDLGSRRRASSARFRSSGARSTRRSWRC